MAYTASLTGQSVFGNQSVQFYTVTADAASGTVSTGLGTITGLNVTMGSVTTANSVAYPRIRPNATAAGAASAGVIGFSGLTSGDVLYLMVYGR